MAQLTDRQEHPFESEKQSNVLDQVREKMKVYDQDGNEVGEVADIFYGAGTDEIEGQGAIGTGAGSRDPASRDQTTLVDLIGEAISPSQDIPEEVEERLLNDGFVRIDRGILSADAYIFPQQIDHVSEDRITLKVKRDDLLELGGA